MLCAGVALSRALVRTLKLLVKAFPAAPSRPRGAMAVTLTEASVAVFVSVTSPATGLAAVGRRGGSSLARSTDSGTSIASKVHLGLCQM